jgi:hypothetical protein
VKKGYESNRRIICDTEVGKGRGIRKDHNGDEYNQSILFPCMGTS